MSELLTCPQGHRWRLTTEQGVVDADPGAVCPVCGASPALVAVPSGSVRDSCLEDDAPPLPKPRPAAVAEVAARLLQFLGPLPEPNRPAVADQGGTLDPGLSAAELAHSGSRR